MSLEDIFTLPAEYNELRSSVRALSEKEIAPFAQAVDADHRYPQEAHNALVKAGLFAAHVPTEFGGDGADALAGVGQHPGELRVVDPETGALHPLFRPDSTMGGPGDGLHPNRAGYAAMAAAIDLAALNL